MECGDIEPSLSREFDDGRSIGQGTIVIDDGAVDQVIPLQADSRP